MGDAVGVALCVSATSVMLASVVLQVKFISGMIQNWSSRGCGDDMVVAVISRALSISSSHDMNPSLQLSTCVRNKLLKIAHVILKANLLY